MIYRRYDAEEHGRPYGIWQYLTRELPHDFKLVYQFKYALKCLVTTRLAIRYQRSFLGFFWALLNPLLTLIVLGVVFSMLMNRPLKTFTIYIFSGIIPWQFFNSVIKHGSRSIIRNQSLIRKIYIPKLLFPIADIGNELFNFIFSICAMFLLLQFIGAGIHIQLVLLPLALFCLTLFTFGITLLLMVLTTFYRDVEHIIDVLLKLLYFLSPILWETERFIGKAWYFDVVIKFNPLTYILGPFHSIFRYGEWPSLHMWIVAISLALTSSICGYMVYKRYENKLIFRI